MGAARKASSHRSAEFLRRVRTPGDLRRIAVLRSGMLGDTVFITPVLDRIRRSFPDAEVHAFVSGGSAPILAAMDLAGVHVLPSVRSLAREARFYLALRRRAFDLLLILETNSHYVIMGKLAGARFLAGFENKLGGLLDYTAPWDPDAHFVENQLAPVREWTVSPGVDRLRLSVTDDESAEAAALLRSAGVAEALPLVCVHPGTSVPGSVRQWVAARYAAVADMLVRHFGCAIAFTGTAADLPEVAQIRGLMRSPSANLAGSTSLRQLMAVLRRAKLVIGPDTGALHLAVGVGTPVVMLMGYANPRDTGPYDPGGPSRVVRVDLECSPCVERNPMPAQWEICKVIRPTLCMSLVTEEMVLEAATDILGRPVHEILHP